MLFVVTCIAYSTSVVSYLNIYQGILLPQFGGRERERENLTSVVFCSAGYQLPFATYDSIIEPRHEKTNILVSDLVRHKPGCTATEDG